MTHVAIVLHRLDPYRAGRTRSSQVIVLGKLKEKKGLSRAVILEREALVLRLREHLDRWMFLTNLAAYVSSPQCPIKQGRGRYPYIPRALVFPSIPLVRISLTGSLGGSHHHREREPVWLRSPRCPIRPEPYSHRIA